jgi:NDP-hexose 2,3-enoyl reductase
MARRGDKSAMLGHSARQQRIADNLTRLQAFEDLAAELGLPPTVLALAWLLFRPGVTAPVLGPRTLDS